jgi:peptidoglycan/xylan/chitin deacetylase (PgdA/CDA1 family)
MNLPILMYHHIQADSPVLYNLTVPLRSFERQIRWLSQEGYETISLERLGRFIRGQDTLPKNPVIITFDDGYQSVWEHAKPVLDQSDFTATVFLVFRAIGRHNIWDLQKSVATLPCMDKATCRQLLYDGWEIGSHGLNHYALTELAPDALSDELTGSKISLEQLFQCRVTAFCYPYGAWNQRIQEHVKRAGYRVACAISPKSASVIDDPWALRRIKVKGSDTLADFRRKISNWYLTYRAWRNR